MHSGSYDRANGFGVDDSGKIMSSGGNKLSLMSHGSHTITSSSRQREKKVLEKKKEGVG